MNIQGGVGRISRKGGLELCKLFVLVLFFSLWSEVNTIKMEWSFVSPYQLSQQQNSNNWYPLTGGDTADIDFSKGGSLAFVPASFAPGSARYGLYNRPFTPREINVYLSKPKHSRESESSSEEHKRKKKRHHESVEDYPEHHHNDHPEYHEHHESPTEELNDEHAEQAEVSGQMADAFNQMIQLKKGQLLKHVELRDEELSRGNEEAARKEQAIINIYEKQLEYLAGIEKGEEAIMTGEISMYYDDDGAGHKHGEGHGHHEHHGDHEHEHGGHEPNHHHHKHDDDDDGGDDHENHHHHGEDDDNDDEDHENHHHHGGDDDDDDEDHENHHHHHSGDDHDDDEDHENHHHHGGDDQEGHHGHDGHHETGEGHGHDHQGEHHHGNQDGDEYHDAEAHLSDNDDENGDPDYDPNNEHEVERRSPFVSSLLPSLSSSDPSPPLKSPDTTTADTAVKADATADVNANTAEATANAAAEATVTAPSPDPSPATPSTTEVSATADASASTSSTNAAASSSATAVIPSKSSNSNSGWLSWFGSSSDNPSYSPYGLLKYLSPSDKSTDNIMSMFNVFADPSNSAYLSNASTVMRIVMFFMPGTGIVDQINFTMALSKIMWEAASMYYDGYGTTEIAVIVLGEMAEAAYLGETIKIDGMDPPAFLKYVKNMKYPDLTEAQEEKLSKDIDNLVTMTYPIISPELKQTLSAGLKDSLKFLSLFTVEGDLKVDNVDVDFSEVFIKMHSAFEDSPLEKIKKSILSAIDTIKLKFQK